MAFTKLKANRQVEAKTITFDLFADYIAQGQTWALSSDNSTVLTGLADPVGNNDAVTKQYVDQLVDTNMRSPDGFATTTNGDYPSDYKGTGTVREGDTFYVTDTTNGTTVGTQTVNVGDLLVALVDNPGNTDSNWVIIESNRDQATETVKGVARIATQTEVDTGTDDTTIVTPLKLKTTLSNSGITEVIAGNGLIETTSGNTKTIDVVSDNAGIAVNADSIALTIGTDNGTSLEISTTGVELAQTITGARTFQPGSGNAFVIDADANLSQLTQQPDGTVDLAIATTKYVNDQITGLGTQVFGETPTVTDGSANVTLANTPRTNTERVYLNGLRMNRGSGNDYTISGNTITFANALQTGDVVVVDYIY